MGTISTSPNSGIINNPLANVIEGLVTGAQLHAHLRQQQDQHEAMQRYAVQQQRENTLQDIQQRMADAVQSRPVENGTVRQDGATSEGGGLSVQLPEYVRKADKSRMYRYKDAQGQTVERELFTPEEQASRTLARMSAQAQATGAAVPISETLAKMTGLQAGANVHPGVLGPLMNAVTQDQEIDTPPDVQEATGAPARIPARMLPSLTAASVRSQNSQRATSARSEPKYVKTVTDNDGNVTSIYSDGSTKVVGRIGAAKVAKTGGGGVAGGGAPAMPNAGTPEDDTLNHLADEWSRGVPLSQLMRGMGRQAGSRAQQIQTRAYQRHPDLNFASAQSGLSADSGSLKKVQASFDAVDNAERIAGRNLDTFTETARKLSDSGSPLLNKPLRELQGRLMGSTEKAAFDAARVIVNPEVAKVLTNVGGGGGTALSDSARHEVEALTNPDATLGQMLAAVGVIRRDMKNRREEAVKTIDSVKGRISGGQGGAAPKATHRFNPATGQIEEIR